MVRQDVTFDIDEESGAGPAARRVRTAPKIERIDRTAAAPALFNQPARAPCSRSGVDVHHRRVKARGDIGEIDGGRRRNLRLRSLGDWLSLDGRPCARGTRLLDATIAPLGQNYAKQHADD